MNHKILILAGLGVVLIALAMTTPVETASNNNLNDIANNLAINIEFNNDDLFQSNNRDTDTLYYNNESFPKILNVIIGESLSLTTDYYYYELRVNNSNLPVQEYYLGDGMTGNSYFSVYYIIPASSSYKLHRAGSKAGAEMHWYEYNMTIKAK